jgi:RNA polymerase sigma factor (TIGR02999 family)
MQSELNQTNHHEVTRLIDKASAGDNDALNELIPIVYQDLKRIASGIRHKQMVVSKTMNTTSLVNEAWIKIHKYGIEAENRKHFFCIIAQAMRQILINTARQKMSQKRSAKEITFEEASVKSDDEAEWILMLDEILKPIEREHSRLAQVFQLKYFLGMTETEISDLLEISISTVSRDWLMVKKIIINIMT